MRVGDVWHDQADELRIAAPEAAGRPMRDVADGADRLVDLLDHLFADRGRAVEDGRHGGDRDTGTTRHVLDRRHAGALANRPRMGNSRNVSCLQSDLLQPAWGGFRLCSKRFDRDSTEESTNGVARNAEGFDVQTVTAHAVAVVGGAGRRRRIAGRGLRTVRPDRDPEAPGLRRRRGAFGRHQRGHPLQQEISQRHRRAFRWTRSRTAGATTSRGSSASSTRAARPTSTAPPSRRFRAFSSRGLWLGLNDFVSANSGFSDFAPSLFA